MRAIVLPARALACACVIGAVTLATPARAQQSSNKVAAEALFEQGRQLVAAGKYADACPKLADSQRLDPSSSTLLNLASCYEKAGRTATAWATYKEAASSANATNRKEYQAAAERHAAALEPKLAHATITAAAPVDGLEISLDGSPVVKSAWGAAIPVDAGSHAVEARAPGKKPYSGKIDVKADGDSIAFAVPELEAAPEAPAPVAPVVAPAPAPPPEAAAAPTQPAAPVETAPYISGQRLAAVIVGGVGVVGVGVGTLFAFSAKSKYDDSLKLCSQTDQNVCSQAGVSQRDDARSAGNLATVGFIVGGVALATGAVLWLTAPNSNASARVGVVPTLGGAMVRGTW
jgi:serine/threonine-protein kinase